MNRTDNNNKKRNNNQSEKKVDKNKYMHKKAEDGSATGE